MPLCKDTELDATGFSPWSHLRVEREQPIVDPIGKGNGPEANGNAPLPGRPAHSCVDLVANEPNPCSNGNETKPTPLPQSAIETKPASGSKSKGRAG